MLGLLAYGPAGLSCRATTCRLSTSEALWLPAQVHWYSTLTLTQLTCGAMQDQDATPLSPGAPPGSRLRSVFVVGDPDQAIYGWRGADSGNMRSLFSRDFAGAKVRCGCCRPLSEASCSHTLTEIRAALAAQPPRLLPCDLARLCCTCRPHSQPLRRCRCCRRPCAVQMLQLRDNYRSAECILTLAQRVIDHNKDEERGALKPKLPRREDVEVSVVAAQVTAPTKGVVWCAMRYVCYAPKRCACRKPGPQSVVLPLAAC